MRLYEAARASVEEAERAIATAREDQANAIVSLLSTGLDANTVAGALGVDARRVREARASARSDRTQEPTRGTPSPGAP